MTPQATAVAIALPFVAWRQYSRARHSIGLQTSMLWSHCTAAVAFPLLLAMLFAFSLAVPSAALGLGAGVATGIGLGFWGLRLTRFELTPEGAYFTPNPYLGTSLVALFALRIAYRMFQLYSAGPAMANDPTGGFGHNPLTYLVFGVLAGYYATYAIGLIRWRRGTWVPARDTV